VPPLHYAIVLLLTDARNGQAHAQATLWDPKVLGRHTPALGASQHGHIFQLELT
jgi:hypothetical protein